MWPDDSLFTFYRHYAQFESLFFYILTFFTKASHSQSFVVFDMPIRFTPIASFPDHSMISVTVIARSKGI